MKSKLLLFNFFFLFITTTLFSQNWLNLTNADYQRDLLIQGDFIWIATSGGGLVKYNHVTDVKEYFNATNSDLPSNCINKIVEDSEANLWLATNKGLVKFQPEENIWTVWNKDNSPLLANNIISLSILDDKIWAQSADTFFNHIFRFDGENWYFPEHFNGNPPINDVIGMQSMGDSVYVGNDDGLSLVTEDTIILWNEDNSILNDRTVSAIKFDNVNAIWIGQKEQATKLENGNFTAFETWHGAPSQFTFDEALNPYFSSWGTFQGIINDEPFAIHSFLSDVPFEELTSLDYQENGILWFATYADGFISGKKFGLVKYDLTNDEWTAFDISPTPLQSNRTSSLTKLDNGIITFLDGDWGLTSVYNNSWTNESMFSDEVTAIYEEVTLNKLWVGKYNGNFCEKFNNEWICHNGLPVNGRINDLIRYNGLLWIATEHSIYSFDGENVIDYTTVFDLNFNLNKIQRLRVDHDNNLWFTSLASFEKRIYRWDGTTLSIFDSDFFDNQFSLPIEGDMEVDAEGNIWFSGGSTELPPLNGTSGLLKYDGTDWTRFNSDNSDLPFGRFHDIYIDDDGFFYLATTNRGLIKTDFETYQQWTTENSNLPENSLRRVVKDNFGQLWISTQKSGLVIFNETGVATDTEDILPLNDEITVFPNPFHDEISIKMNHKNFEKLSVELMDINGRLIQELLHKEEYASILSFQNLSISSGIYFLRLTIDNQIFTKRIVKL